MLNADGSFIYTPVANYNGPDTFAYTASDGVVQSTPATVRIAVSKVNDAPAALPESYTTAEDTPFSSGAPGVLANDTDPDGDSLSAVPVAGPSHGTVS